MAFRVVLIEKEAGISVKLNNLIVRKDGDDIWIPLDDISMVVIDNLTCSITIRTLYQLAEAGIGAIICDQKHLPVGYYGAYDNHSRSSKIIGFQIDKSIEFYDSFWSEIVKNKIENQAKAYLLLKDDFDGYEKILEFSSRIEAGDKTNREAHAAKVYFNRLMGNTFSRGNDNILLNSGLDYGYAIIRSYIARLCVAYGLNTQIGIHHKNEYNRFNLVDDLMEPIRPFVDLVAYRILYGQEYFMPEHRHGLVGILNRKIKYCKKKMFFDNMLEEYITQVAAFIQCKKHYVTFPNIDDFILEEVEDEI